MSRPVTKAQNNRYCQARLNAAKYNEKFLTRVGAADFLPGVTEDSLKKYELDITRPPNIVVALMADAYNCPELRTWYCVNECPLGKDRREIPDMPPERVPIRVFNALKGLNEAMDTLTLIMDDGIIDEHEKKLLPEIEAQILETRQRLDETLAMLEKASRIGQFI